MQTFAEIEINRRQILNEVTGRPVDFFGVWTAAPDELVSAGEIVRQIEDARAADVRVLLVAIRDCGGGLISACDSVFQALLRFSEDGLRRVVVHVCGYAGSGAVDIALAGDLILMASDAEFRLHSAIFDWPNDPAGAERARAAQNARQRALWLERSAMPPGSADYILQATASERACDTARTVYALRPPRALEWRWIDGVGDLDAARSLAACLAAGGDPGLFQRFAMLRDRRRRLEGYCSVQPTPLVFVSDAMANLAGKVTAFSQAAAPATGMNPGDQWQNTDTTTACVLGTSCPGTLNTDGTQRSPASHRAAGWLHTYNGTAWASGYQGKKIVVPTTDLQLGPTGFADLWSWGTKKLALGTTPTADALYAYYLLTGAAESNVLLRGCVTNGAQIGRFKITAPGNYLVSYRAQVARTTATNGHVLASVYRIRGNTLVQQTYIYCTGTNYNTSADQGLILAADTAANDEFELCLTGYSATAQGQFQFTIQRLPD